jgi:hypothetical protein
MIHILDTIAFAVQYGSLGALVYGAILALEVDVSIDRALKARPSRALATTA